MCELSVIITARLQRMGDLCPPDTRGLGELSEVRQPGRQAVTCRLGGRDREVYGDVCADRRSPCFVWPCVVLRN